MIGGVQSIGKWINKTQVDEELNRLTLDLGLMQRRVDVVALAFNGGQPASSWTENGQNEEGWRQSCVKATSKDKRCVIIQRSKVASERKQMGEQEESLRIIIVVSVTTFPYWGYSCFLLTVINSEVIHFELIILNVSIRSKTTIRDVERVSFWGDLLIGVRMVFEFAVVFLLFPSVCQLVKWKQIKQTAQQNETKRFLILTEN